MGLAREERRLLVDLLTEVGPDAPTLCDPWKTRDLVAHLVIRERRFDAAPGIVLKPFAGYTQRVQDEYAKKAWSELLDELRSGPPFWSPYSIGVLDELGNTVEFYVHHEDVRRAVPDWEPRPADARRDKALWRALPHTGRLNYRNSPVGVVLRRPDGEQVTVKHGANGVVITGEPGELLLHAFGRDQARIEISGSDDAVSAVKALNRGI
ncbi:TIGR03085 family protein [Lentzea sp. NBRC 105346]|uniref:TIGR03085 family metal-binding protein n=1 Tax=Lentzea sp. NBRC 105346 TaxID=3032205 RepID=UPI0024A5FA3F|nr:TIGR03085 family metal-binding protein [Lentzea sp. NBRC 105346]GLZ29836.1 TIGR03085 family protein [Lentzea sp. NBRC 105346]